MLTLSRNRNRQNRIELTGLLENILINGDSPLWKKKGACFKSYAYPWPTWARQSPDWPSESRKAFRNRKQHEYEIFFSHCAQRKLDLDM